MIFRPRIITQKMVNAPQERHYFCDVHPVSQVEGTRACYLNAAPGLFGGRLSSAQGGFEAAKVVYLLMNLAVLHDYGALRARRRGEIPAAVHLPR